ncbi:MAG: hypothetical protein JNL21_19160 [Myxococcales bacterium]|nr:hypothetical protein [Myxococcales bacterium]
MLNVGLSACASCGCHHRNESAACPHCGAALGAPGSTSRTAASLLLGLTLAAGAASAAGCGDDSGSGGQGGSGTTNATSTTNTGVQTTWVSSTSAYGTAATSGSGG